MKAVDTDSDGTYECSVNGTYANVTFCRMNPGYDTMEWGTSEENRIWNKVEGLTVPTTEENCCYVSDWNAGEWNILNYTWSVKENCLYLKPNSNWVQAGARFAAYFCNGTETAKWVDMTKVGANGYYEVEVPGTTTEYKNVIFCRMNPGTTENNWDNKWNQSGDLTWNLTKNACAINDGQWDCDQNVTWSTITEY